MKMPTLLPIETVPVADVIARDRLRPTSEAGVAGLVASITELGVMKDAIQVRQKMDGSLWLMAGGHRLEAALLLGWTEIPAKVWTGVSDDWAQMMEIDDNLAGAEMNALDTAIFLAARKEVYERLHPETRAATGAALAAKRWSADASDIVSFASTTAEKFGISKRHVERMIAAGGRLGPDEVRQLREAPRAVSLKDLTEIGKITNSAERYDVVRCLASGTVRSAAEARRMGRTSTGPSSPVQTSVSQQLSALKTAWARAGSAARRRFVAEYRAEIALMMEGDEE